MKDQHQLKKSKSTEKKTLPPKTATQEFGMTLTI